MTKDWVEERVRWLLDRACRWVYKPPDGLHTGPVKIDFVGCGHDGRFWMVEVKQTDTQRHYNPHVKGSKGISALQREALNAAANGPGSVVLVAVWLGTQLHIFDWRKVQDLALWSWQDALVRQPFTTRKLWDQFHLDLWVNQ